MHEVREYIEVEARKHVIFYCSHPHGLGLFKLRDICERGTLIATNPPWLGHHEFHFVKHDVALNFKRSPFTRQGWILLLGYPFDYKNTPFWINYVLHLGNSFIGIMLNRSMASVLVKVLIDDPLEISRSLTMKQGFD